MKHLIANLWLLGLTILICAVLYPLVLLGIGQLLMPDRANGSMVTDAQGTVVGSRLIAQPFYSARYFQPRPSAVSYNAAATGGSNWGASNPNLRKRVADQLQAEGGARPVFPRGKPIPSDLVLASGSGMDPHITVKGAEYQLDRVATAWASELGRESDEVRKEVQAIVEQQTEAPIGGLVGPDLINVLETNLALEAHFSR
jgi:potassium-transporting ATPase KdpC subunit